MPAEGPVAPPSSICVLEVRQGRTYRLRRDMDTRHVQHSVSDAGVTKKQGSEYSFGKVYSDPCFPDAGSPAIGAADPSSMQPDQRFYPVVGVKDMGAVERQNPEDIIFRDDMENS